jgi:hypothetical protein
MSLAVIGAGFGRTGTLSLKLALEQLGFDPCYHMAEVLTHPEHDAMWLALARGETSDWPPPLSAYKAIVDWPGVSFWKQFAAANPHAKIVLTLRDAEAWYASCTATIFARMEDGLRTPPSDPARRRHLQMVNDIVIERTFGGSLAKANVLRVFNAHNDDVRDSVPPERLLVYRAGEGWEPLCHFLGRPVPADPYPAVNTRADFNARFPVPR